MVYHTENVPKTCSGPKNVLTTTFSAHSENVLSGTLGHNVLRVRNTRVLPKLGVLPPSITGASTINTIPAIRLVQHVTMGHFEVIFIDFIFSRFFHGQADLFREKKLNFFLNI